MAYNKVQKHCDKHSCRAQYGVLYTSPCGQTVICCEYFSCFLQRIVKILAESVLKLFNKFAVHVLSGTVQYKTLGYCLVSLYLIKHSCSFIKQYLNIEEFLLKPTLQCTCIYSSVSTFSFKVKVSVMSFLGLSTGSELP